MKKIIVFLVLLPIFGCSFTKTVPVRLYGVSKPEVIQAEFIFSGTTHGQISFRLPSGEEFNGEYNTVRRGYDAQWGDVYGQGGGYLNVAPTEYVGSAIAISDRGRTFTCEYTTNTSMWTPHGNGVCVDNSGNYYKLMY